MAGGWACAYETTKYVVIRDSRLVALRSLMLIAIVSYVVIFELWAQGGWLETVPVVGVVRFSLQQPTVHDCDPNEEGCQNAFEALNELSYCAQHYSDEGEVMATGYSGNVYPCEIYEATNAQILAEKSIAIITRASTRQQELVCHSHDLVCPRTYNDTLSVEHKFYTAQSEAFTILVDHSVTASKICTARPHNHYACSSQSSTYQGRLHVRKNTELCAQEFAKNNSFDSFRGTALKATAPCYVGPNRTVHHLDFFSLDVLLRSVGMNMDECNTNAGGDPAENPCQTVRETGGTVLLNVYWSDFQVYHGVVEPYYYYAPQFLSGSSFKQEIPFYETYRDSRILLKAHGIRVAVLLGGDYHQFNAVAFLVTLTTALGLLAVATTAVDAIMLYLLPEKKRYQQAKYEEELASEDNQLDNSNATNNNDNHNDQESHRLESTPVDDEEVQSSVELLQRNDTTNLNEPLLSQTG